MNTTPADDRAVPPPLPRAAVNGAQVYASFARRAAAWLVDTVILWLLAGALIVAIYTTSGGLALPAVPAGAASPALSLVYPSFFLLHWLYYALFESSARQATPGKLALGIKVTTLEGERISFGRASGRYFARLINAFSLNIGYLIAAFTQRRQGLHDLIAGTVVTRDTCTPQLIAGSGPAVGGSGLLAVIAVCLLVLLPIVGILAAIAIPAYQDYTIRAQVADGLARASAAQAGVGDYYQRNGAWPTALAPSTRPDLGRYLSALTTSGGAITATFGAGAHPALATHAVSLNATLTEGGDLVWVCAHGPDPAGPVTHVGAGRTDVPDRFLPRACRG